MAHASTLCNDVNGLIDAEKLTIYLTNLINVAKKQCMNLLIGIMAAIYKTITYMKYDFMLNVVLDGPNDHVIIFT